MIVEESIQTKNDILTEYYNKTVAYDRVLEGNLLLWTEYLDNCLKDYVVRYNSRPEHNLSTKKDLK